MAVINRLRSGRDRYTDRAFSQLKDVLVAVAQTVLRRQTPEEAERWQDLTELDEVLRF